MKCLYRVLCALALLSSGCGSSSNEPLSQEGTKEVVLNDVGELYRLYTAQNQKPPTKIADLVPLEATNPMGLMALQTGDVIVRFGAKLPTTLEGPSPSGGDEVLAYEKEVPASGGRVLMLDRTIHSMTADEFKAAKLAGDSSSDTSAAKSS